MNKLAKKNTHVLKFAVVCVFFLIVFVCYCLTVYFRNNDSRKDCDCAEPITVFEYDKAYYEHWDEEYLKKVGLYKDITVNDLDEKLLVLPDGVIPHDKRYDGCIVYEYKPVNSKAVIAVDKKGEYQLFGFCNFVDDLPNDGKRILDVYNVTSADDIVSIDVISPYEKNIWGVTTPKVVSTITNREFIEVFYEEYKNMVDVGFDYYEDDVFSDMTEEQWQNGDYWYIEGGRNFHLKVKNGIEIKLSFYPSVGYMEGYLGYYKLSDKFKELLESI